MHEQSKTNLFLGRTLIIGSLVLIIGTALSGGIVTPWSKAMLALAILVLTLLLVIKGIINQKLTLAIPSLVWPLVAAIALGVVQSVSWFDQAGVRQSLSMEVEGTREALFMFVLLLLWLLLCANIFGSALQLRILTNFLVVYGLGLAFLALVLYLAWRQNLNWLRPIEVGSPVGTFVNRNHFAGYIEFLLPIPVAMLIVYRANLENRIFYVAAAVMMGVALCFSLSRGGMISMCAQLLFLAALSSSWQVSPHRLPNAKQKARILRWASIGAIFLLIVIGIIAMGAEPIIFRIADIDDRSAIWADSWRIFCAHPYLGTGLGTFATAFPIYAHDNGFDVAAQAHSDYLQILTDTGLTGFVIFLWFLAILVRAVRRSLKSSAEPRQIALALGCAAGLFGLLVHSLFDFNLQLPSHALLFLLYGAVCVQIASQTSAKIQPNLVTVERPVILAVKYNLSTHRKIISSDITDRNREIL